MYILLMKCIKCTSLYEMYTLYVIKLNSDELNFLSAE